MRVWLVELAVPFQCGVDIEGEKIFPHQIAAINTNTHMAKFKWSKFYTQTENAWKNKMIIGK